MRCADGVSVRLFEDGCLRDVPRARAPCQSRTGQLRECGEARSGQGELATANEPLYPVLDQSISINYPRRICSHRLTASLKSQPEYFLFLRRPIMSMSMIIRPFGWVGPC
jgi:hypothetical protein